MAKLLLELAEDIRERSLSVDAVSEPEIGSGCLLMSHVAHQELEGSDRSEHHGRGELRVSEAVEQLQVALGE